jgi:putative copper resistance protein D
LIETGLVSARFAHLAAATAVFGVALFPFYGDRRLVGTPARINRWRRVSLWTACLLALLSGLAWGFFTLAAMVGTLSAAIDPDTVLFVLRETSFGLVWAARLALAAVAIGQLMRRVGDDEGRDPLLLLISVILLLSLALTGHTQANEGVLRVIHICVDAVHLLAAGAWLGGLVQLLFLIVLAVRLPSTDHLNLATMALARFSGMGYLAVAVLLASGLVNAWVLLGAANHLASTPYGQALSLKLVLFLGMLGLAAHNRLRLVPALTTDVKGAVPDTLRRLRRNVAGELLLGLSVLGIVAFLGTMQPPIATFP